jgi:hypothetical protein
MEERDEWRKNLKVGDPVGIDSRWNKYITKVIKITPTGRIVVSVGQAEETFRPSGVSTGGDSYSKNYLVEPTQKFRDEILMEKIPNWLSNIDWRKLPLELLKSIRDMIKKYEETQK